MDIQLQYGKTNRYCFVTDAPKLARGKKRGEIAFELAFVLAEHIVPGDKTSDIENVPLGTMTMRVDELAAYWASNPEWRVVG